MKKKQFTLIEMLVVIAIIAVLATMIGSAVFGVREKGNRTACLNNLKQLYTAANSYKDAQGSFPFVSGKHTTQSGGDNHVINLLLIRRTEAGENPNLYICPSAAGVTAGKDEELKEVKKAAIGNVYTEFKNENNSYAYFMGKEGDKASNMRPTSGILADGFRAANGTDSSDITDAGWNHSGAGNWVNVDSSGRQSEDDKWPDMVKGNPNAKADWKTFQLD